jgi:hypothetical protein
MTRLKLAAAALGTALLLAGCQSTGGGGGAGGGGTLATQANLSPDAIRLQSAEQRLLSLAEEQRAAADRVQSFAIQGGALGALGGAVTGYLGCTLANCDSNQRNAAAVAGAVGGGVFGANAGANQARRQNTEAARENAIRRRIQVAGQQLDSAREARRLAQNVAAQNARTLNQIRAEVAAGRRDSGDLRLARADARADAKVMQSSLRTLDRSTKSLSGEDRLSSQQARLAQEEAAVQRSYDALNASIRNAAL